MKKALMLPLFAAALFASACEEDSTGLENQARIRFVNAITGVTGNVGFTASGTFIGGSSVAFGSGSSTCATLDAATGVPLAFGTVNATGTGLSGVALTTSTQNLAGSGNFTAYAAGTAAAPSLFFLSNSFSGTLNSNQASVRFVNLVPTATTANLDVFAGTSTTPTVSDLTFGNANTYGIVTSGANTFTIRNAAGTNVLTSSSVTLISGTVNTVAIVPTAAGGYQLVNVTSCP